MPAELERMRPGPLGTEHLENKQVERALQKIRLANGHGLHLGALGKFWVHSKRRGKGLTSATCFSVGLWMPSDQTLPAPSEPPTP